MKRSRAAFTLLEIMMAIAMAVIIFTIAVPAISSAFGGNGLEQTFRDFDNFVHQTQTRAMQERRDYLLIWQKEGITAEPAVMSPDDSEGEIPMFASGTARITLERPVALDKKPAGEWPIWRSGTLEPVRITYEGDLGKWVAEYDALTGRGQITLMNER